MTLRLRLALALAAVAAASALVFGVVTYRAADQELREEVDRSLVDAARTVGGRRNVRDRCVSPQFGSGGRDEGFRPMLLQVIDSDGHFACSYYDEHVPLDGEARSVATSNRSVAALGSVSHKGVTYRTLTISRPEGGALQLARSIEEAERSLRHLRGRMLVATLAVAAAGAAIGWLVAHRITRHLVALTDVAERIASTGELAAVPRHGGLDEVGRLGTAFEQMVTSLSESRLAQQRLVQDAGHELRTPLTSMRTNVALLGRLDQLSTDDRTRLISDLDSESRELTNLVNQLVSLATDGDTAEEHTTLDLAGVAARVAERARRRAGREVIVTVNAPIPISGPATAVERAVGNLVENATKFAPTGAIEIAVFGTTLTVRDHGPGLASGDEDRIFERFYRSDAARSTSGSGLGLSIVRDVMSRIGGLATAGNHPDGGAIITLEFTR